MHENKKNHKLTESEDFANRILIFKTKASQAAFDALREISMNYEKKYEFPKKMPWEKINIYQT